MSEGPAAMRLFRVHLIAYFAIAVALFVLNQFVLGGPPWFLLFVVGWGTPLGIHCAWAMGLFGGGRT